ncbi:MAG: exodeoxyribonuclease VII large subunit [Chloroflexi bacterium]|nr:exodeoxyribonuclease VII large subunit [Chloroflexota bacterium]
MPVYSVSDVTRYIKDALDRDAMLGDLWVAGEVSNFTRSALGHHYFTLKDQAAQLRGVMFRNGSGGQFLASGAAVVVHGRISFYAVRGELQLYADLVQPEGVGELYLEFERLKAKLQAEGLFEPARKRPLPRFPRRIGVATSPVGAVWHDIQNVIRRRYPLVELALAACQVQGNGAAATIVEALQVVNARDDIDVVILARGGGSLEELWPFNEEAVARAIFASRAPVISGVGHETDVTVADLVADVRAPTPSAAAEMAVPDVRELRATVVGYEGVLLAQMEEHVRGRRVEVERVASRLRSRAPDAETPRQRIDDLLRAASARLEAALALHRERLRGLGLRLEALNPSAVLQRGFAVVQQERDGSIVRSVAQVSLGDALRVQVRDGAFGATVR